MYESSTKETKWACIQLACSWRPRALEEAHCWNIQAKFYNEKFPLVYESDKTGDSLSWRLWCYFEAQVWQRIATLSLLSFSLIFLFLTWDNALENDDHHTSIYLQLDTRTKYDSIWMPLAVYRDMQWTKSDMYERIMNGGFATNTMSTTWLC